MSASSVKHPTTGYRSNLALLRGAQKPSAGTAAYSRHINRPLARRVAALAHQTGLSPNAATAISAAASATGLVVLATSRPTSLSGLLVALLLAAGYVMDSVDGQLARLRGRGSLSGEMLDHSVDCVKTVTLHLAVLISLYRYPAVDDPRWLLVPVGFLVVDVVSFFGLVTMPLLRKLHQVGGIVETRPSRAEHPVRRFVLLPTDYGTFCWMFVLLGWQRLFFATYFVMFCLNALVLVPVLLKWRRELLRMDGPS